jgi:type II secretory pathway component GspD/PulD (secretin)
MTSWRHSIAGMALCAFLAPAAENVGAQDSPNPAPSGSTIQRKTTESPRPPADPIPEPTRLGVTQPKNQQEAPADGGTESVPLRTGDESGSAVVGSEPGQPQQAAPAPQRIKIFRITHRQPGEILEILRGLTPVFEGGAQGVPVSYAAFLSEGLNARPGMNPGGPGSGPGANMASMMAKMGRRTGSGGMAAKMGGPGVSSATEAPPSPCYFAVDGRTRSLIVRGTEKDLQAVADFVAILDLPDDKAIPKLKNVHAFKLRFAKPSVVIEVLKTLNIDVLVAQIPKSTILLLNGPDSAIKDATEIIEALDAEVKEGATKGPQGEPAPSETRLVH